MTRVVFDVIRYEQVFRKSLMAKMLLQKSMKRSHRPWPFNNIKRKGTPAKTFTILTKNGRVRHNYFGIYEQYRCITRISRTYDIALVYLCNFVERAH